jgi:transposase
MTKKPQTSKVAAENLVKNIRRKTRQTYSAEEKIRAPATPATTLGNCLSSLSYRSCADQPRAPKWPPLVGQKNAFSETS